MDVVVPEVIVELYMSVRKISRMDAENEMQTIALNIGSEVKLL